jgi:uncharacterized protein YhdP
MSDILLLAAIVMLVLLFLKVPVYLAVLGGSMVYFALNPHVSAAVFAQQTIIGTDFTAGNSIFCLRRNFYELHRSHEKDHGFL